MTQASEPLPQVSSKEPLSYFWFPTPAQCFIYRNWEMLTPERLALILNVPTETVLQMAQDLGLPKPATLQQQETWIRVGYATLIRANWHLLPFSQLCTLLGWDEAFLAHTLRHDDFLDIKNGDKPTVLPLTVQPLTPEQVQKTKRIAEITRSIRSSLGPRKAEPFHFSPFYPAPDQILPFPHESALDSSYCLSYCALYGHVFEESLLDYSFPDALLDAYSAMGIRAILVQGVLYSLVPFALAPQLADGCEKKLSGMRSLVQRLARHGMKLYVYLNEPRDLPDAFFEQYPDYKGDVYTPGYASVCLSVPEVQDAFRKAIYDLTAAVPGIGGYSICTASENHTNCYSHKADGETTCPRCRNKSRAELFATVIRLVTEGAHAADPSVKIIAASWQWDDARFDTAGNCLDEVCARVPKSTAIWAVSENKATKQIGDVLCSVNDYSISIPGPSDYIRNLFTVVKSHDLPVVAKLQLNNSWEFSSVPYIPVFHHFYTNIRDLMEQVQPNSVHLSWTQGGFPSPVHDMFRRLTAKEALIPDFEDLMLQLFPTAQPEILLDAFRLFDEAFDAYPFSVQTMYVGPQHMGPALPLYPQDTGFYACMCGPSYDDLDSWRCDFAPDAFAQQFAKLAEGFRQGFDKLQEAFRDCPITKEIQLLLDCAEVSYLHFASVVNHVHYVMKRQSSEDLSLLIQEEATLALREAAIMLRNPMIGYEATNHYYFTVTDLYEKVLNCQALLGKL